MIDFTVVVKQSWIKQLDRKMWLVMFKQNQLRKEVKPRYFTSIFHAIRFAQELTSCSESLSMLLRKSDNPSPRSVASPSVH